jgi:hypothetical protein
MKAVSPTRIRSPFPWFGGKSAVADIVWSRFGDVANYVEPFCGSAAVLFSRPHWPWDGHRIETVNDADGFLCNFWRAVSADPDAVADHADYPVSELDLHARHFWLVNTARPQVERLREDPEFYDVKIAGWWVWGACQWIGSGWCHHPEWQQLPHLGDAGMGVHRPSQKLPHLGDAGRGVHRPSQQLPHLGNAGRGVHRPSQQLPHLGDAGRGELHAYFRLIADRLRRVRVCCGDWSRVLGPTPTVRLGTTAVFLDPPYTDKADRKSGVYARDDESVGHKVCEWAKANGDNPELRIALCGYEGEYDMPDEWECVAWKARGGYGSQGDGVTTKGRNNSERERVWFSPHCIRPNQNRSLFD